MPFVRILHQPPAELAALYATRIGIPELAARLSDREGVLALITDASPEALSHFAPGDRFLGDPDRARGCALVAAPLETLFRAVETLRSSSRPGAPSLGDALTLALEHASRPPSPLMLGERLFTWGSRTYVMGILNVTPDSFSDGGRHLRLSVALDAASRMIEAGADIIDIGGESTRPGAELVTESEELDRVVPMVEALAARTDVPISVDTTKARVAEAAVRAGAHLVNDVSGFRFDSAMAPTVARTGAAACVMHIQGTPRSMQAAPSYFDVVGEVAEGLEASLAEGVRAGTPRERMLVDPGIGFGKTAGHNLFLLNRLAELKALGRPILVGVSRKGFIGALAGQPSERRLAGSLAAATAAALAGADIARVHDVLETTAALKVADAIRGARQGGFAFLP